MSKYSLNWEQKAARDALGIKNVNKQHEIDAINQYIESRRQPEPAPAPRPEPPQQDFFANNTFDYGQLPSNFINEPMYTAAQFSAQLAMDKTLENIRQAGSTERQKLVNENNLAVTDKEIKGKLDLQKVLNSGYKNIANIERGSNMFSSIMGAFNF